MKIIWSNGLLVAAILIGVASGRYIDLPWDYELDDGLDVRDANDACSWYRYAAHENTDEECIDDEYPGTACRRLVNVVARVEQLTPAQLSGEWSQVRSNLLWAGGMVDNPKHTGHSFNDFNHVDLTTMRMVETSHTNADGKVDGISLNNDLSVVIRKYSIAEVGPGGSWSTCQIGAGREGGPQDVAHVQFHSRVAFKLVWVPGKDYKEFVLVDDEGKLLKVGKPTGNLPYIQSRRDNYHEVECSKFSAAADQEGGKSITHCSNGFTKSN